MAKILINYLDQNDNHQLLTVIVLPKCHSIVLAKMSTDFPPGGNDQGELDVNSTTGEITLLKSPTSLQYTIIVAVADGGTPPLEVNATVYITVDSSKLLGYTFTRTFSFIELLTFLCS